jgi:hypothetical protein
MPISYVALTTVPSSCTYTKMYPGTNKKCTQNSASKKCTLEEILKNLLYENIVNN